MAKTEEAKPDVEEKEKEEPSDEEGSSALDRAEAANKRKEELLEREEKLITRKEKLAAVEMVGGRSEGALGTKKKEEQSAVDYAYDALDGKLNLDEGKS